MAVRLRDVAVLAGVSPRSVSNVINRFHYVSPEMRAKVEAAIEELDYQPNLLARSLRRGRSGTIGLLLPQINNPYFGELAHLVVEQARELGLTVRIDETGGRRQRELALLEQMPALGQVDGIVLSPLGLSKSELTQTRSRVPVVLLGERVTTSTSFDHVGVDSVAAARDITQHLIDGGSTRIAALVEKQHPRASTSRLRLKGYQAALTGAGMTTAPELVGRMDFYPDRRDGADAMARLLDGPARPDAVFCFNDHVAIGALRELYSRGIKVPDDIGVAGFDNVADCDFTIPTLTTIAPDKTALARTALQLLEGRIAGSTEPPQDIRIPYRVVVRDSTRHVGVPTLTT
jgi:DNA-binding LacI/PurR family transcriptional regulator